MADAGQESAGRRRPTPEDLPVVIEKVEETSLRRACAAMGLHPGHTHAALKADPDMWALYVAAVEMRGHDMVEQGLGIAARVLKKELKPDAARVAADILRWANGQMAPKPIRHEHTGPDGGPIKTYDLSRLSEEELDLLEQLRSRIAVAGGDQGGAGTPEEGG